MKSIIIKKNGKFVLLSFLILIGLYSNSYADGVDKGISIFGIDSSSSYNFFVSMFLDKKHSCIKGKSNSLDTVYIDIEKNYNNPPKRLLEICKKDKQLEDWESGTSIKEMKIDVAACEPPDAKLFLVIDSYFSAITKQLLSLHLVFSDIESIINQITEQYGQKVGDNYWERKDDLLLVHKGPEGFWHVLVFYEKNYEKHYSHIEQIGIKKKEEEKKSISDIFK